MWRLAGRLSVASAARGVVRPLRFVRHEGVIVAVPTFDRRVFSTPSVAAESASSSSDSSEEMYDDDDDDVDPELLADDEPVRNPVELFGLTKEKAALLERALARSPLVDMYRDGTQLPKMGGAYQKVWAPTRVLGTDLNRDSALDNPYLTRSEYAEDVYTDMANPAEHTKETIGQWYALPEDFNAKVFPDGLCGDFKEHFDVTGDTDLMVRKHGVELVQAMHQALNGLRAPEFRLLCGPRGIGKSGIMNYAIHYARSNGWITLVVPDAWKVMNSGVLIIPSRDGQSFNQPDLATSMLQTVAALHGEQLSQVKQRLQHPRDRFLSSEADARIIRAKSELQKAEDAEKRRARAAAESKGETWDASEFESKRSQWDQLEDHSQFTLKDLVDWGIRHPPFATEAVVALRQELSLVTEFPVLIAVDGINSLYQPSAYPYRSKLLTCEQLPLPNAFRCLNATGFDPAHKLARGTVLAAVSHTHERAPAMFEQVKVNKTLRMHVQPMDRTETHSMLQHFVDTERFYSLGEIEGEVDPRDVEHYFALSGGRPKVLFETSMFV